VHRNAEMKGKSVRGSSALLLALLAILCHAQQGQQAQTEPSLQETFEWMTNTLKPTEGNNVGVHHPFPKTAANGQDGLDIYDGEIITGFSHTGCQVEFDVDVMNNDEVMIGRRLDWHEVDTFDLKDIDPTSVRVAGEGLVWADDIRGRVVVFKTTDAKPKIHAETTSSSRKTAYAFLHKEKNAKGRVVTTGDIDDEICKAEPGNTAYCDYGNHKEKPVEETQSTFWFSTSEYAERFAKAFRHAVELCGGKPSAF